MLPIHATNHLDVTLLDPQTNTFRCVYNDFPESTQVVFRFCCPARYDVVGHEHQWSVPLAANVLTVNGKRPDDSEKHEFGVNIWYALRNSVIEHMRGRLGALFGHLLPNNMVDNLG